LLPGVSKVTRKTAFAQTGADCAVLACALERYRREHGQVPESLEALCPQFIQKLPHDIINGQPLKYHRTGSGQYILYSVGWNETDEAGVACMPRAEEEKSLAQGDWVWRLP